MQVLTTSLSEEIALLLIREGDAWRFHQWSRVIDGAILPEPSDAARAQAFATPEDALSYFRTLCVTTPSARERIGLEDERAALMAQIPAEGAEYHSPEQRWQKAKRRVEDL